MLSAEQVTKFQMLFKSHFGRTISPREAYEKGVKLVRLIELIGRQMAEVQCREGLSVAKPRSQ